MATAKKTQVLVADDEPSTRALVSNHMRKKGFEVVEAADGDEAWTLAQQHLPELVVLDVMMPGMSGWEVCRRIREAVSLAHTGVVMLTGIGENLNELTSPLYGADAYIDKPFEFSDLDVKVRETLAQRRAGTLGRPDGADVQPPSGRPESALPPTEPPASTLQAPPPSRKAATSKPAPKQPAKQPAAKPAPKPPVKQPAAKPAKKPVAKKPAPKPAKKPVAKKQGKAKPAKKPVARKQGKAKPAKKPIARKQGKAKPAKKPVAKKQGKAKPKRSRR
jgi:CheY-like chemotaxis protein